MNTRTILAVACALVLMLAAVGHASEKYPYRADYQGVVTIETDELHLEWSADKCVVIDVRSQLEFDVIHVQNAVHAAISKQTFIDEVGQIAAANPGKSLAFYCNGTTCLKSYKACEKAQAAGIANCYAYDAGIPEWSVTHPESTVLLGNPVDDPERQLLSKAQFEDRCLTWSQFQAAADGAGVMIIDARDHIQKSGNLEKLPGTRSIPLDIFIPNFVKKRAEQDKTLLIFDQVGKQVKWLQYYLEEYGYENYHFLSGGATAVLQNQSYRS